MNETYFASKAPLPVGPYPHARSFGSLVFLSGIGPRKLGQKEIPGVNLAPDGSIVSYDVAIQTHSVFENLELILDEAGLGLGDIIDVQVFLINMKADFPVFNKVYAEYFDQKTGPTRTTIGVTALPTPIAVELKVIAGRGGMR